MTKNEALTHAKTKRHQSLFHTDGHEKEWLSTDDRHYHCADHWCYFIEPSQPSRVYVAFDDQKAFKALIRNLEARTEPGKPYQFHASEDKDSEGMIDMLRAFYLGAGLQLVSYNIGMTTKQITTMERIAHEKISSYDGNADDRLYQMALDCLDTELFGMDRAEFDRFLREDTTLIHVIYHDAVLAGFVLGQIYNDGKSVFVRGLGVDAPFRSKGYGKALMQTLLSVAAQKGITGSMLWVEKTNTRALNLYRKLGYYPYGDAEALFLLK